MKIFKILMTPRTEKITLKLIRKRQIYSFDKRIMFLFQNNR